MVNLNFNGILVTHHLAYQVDDIEGQVNKLRKKNYGVMTKYLNAKAFEYKRVIFMYSPFKHVIELIEK